MTVALKNKSWSTESQSSSRNRGVTWSNFLVLVTILQAKFCTSCNFLMLVVEVLDHTVEQYSILLKTNDDINCSSVFPSKLYFTRLIWYSFAIQEDTTLEIWQSYVRWESRVTPKSFADATGWSTGGWTGDLALFTFRRSNESGILLRPITYWKSCFGMKLRHGLPCFWRCPGS